MRGPLGAGVGGRVANDSFEALRRGLQTRFRPAAVHATHRPIGRRRAFDRWRATRPFAGAWYELPRPSTPPIRLTAKKPTRNACGCCLTATVCCSANCWIRAAPHPVGRAIPHPAPDGIVRRSGGRTVFRWHSRASIRGVGRLPDTSVRDSRRTRYTGSMRRIPRPLRSARHGFEGRFAETPGQHALVYQGTCLVAVSSATRHASRFIPARRSPGCRTRRIRTPAGPFVSSRASLRVETINGSPAKNSPYLDAFRLAIRRRAQPRTRDPAAPDLTTKMRRDCIRHGPAIPRGLEPPTGAPRCVSSRILPPPGWA